MKLAGQSPEPAPLRSGGHVPPNHVRPEAVHVAENPGPGGAQPIHTAPTREHPEALDRNWLNAGMGETNA
jgi:hypothetical protein